MAMSRLDAMARHMWDARRARQNYANLPDELKPASIAEAYPAQEVYHRLAEPVYGPVAGVKVATTTKVMQELMGITHPCGGAIFARTIHASPARIAKSDFVNLRIESEIALKLGPDMPASGAPWTAESVVPHRRGRDAGLRADRGPQCGLHRDQGGLDDRGELLERRRGDRRAEAGHARRTSSASPDARRSTASRSARANPKTRSRRSPGSPICWPSATATSKPAWW